MIFTKGFMEVLVMEVIIRHYNGLMFNDVIGHFDTMGNRMEHMFKLIM
ncbi:MAG: hypothetical protein ACFCUL_01795 [Flavobacteriaceae bacterium]